MHAVELVGPVLGQLELPAPGPRVAREAAYPTTGYETAYATCAVEISRTLAAAEDSFAEILALIRLGMAIAAMTKMIATTINNSISEKPFWRRISSSCCFQCTRIAIHLLLET